MNSFTGLLPSPTSVVDHVASSDPFALDLGPVIAVASMLPTPTVMDTLSSAAASSSTLLDMISATTTAAIESGKGSKHHGVKNGECELLGPFALFIQGALGGLALLSLVYKRWRERPQRPVKIWAFDASKQVVGSVLLHVANLLMSMFSSGQIVSATTTIMSTTTVGEYQANPCSFYLLNLAIDTTIGIPILIVLLRLLTYAFSLTPMGNPPESIHSGNYGHPPKATWWLKQSLIYFLGLLGMKICVFFIFQICPWIARVGDWSLRWTEGNEALQVVFVMLLFPVIMNALQYYIIDSFIKDQKPTDHEPRPSGDEVEDDHDQGLDPASESEDEAEIIKNVKTNTTSEAEDKHPASDRVTKLKFHSKKLQEYDPDKDGDETSTVLGSGSASTSNGEDDDAVVASNNVDKR